MSDNVIVDRGDSSEQDAATLLLAAAEELDLGASVVSVDTTGPTGRRFSAPEEVVKKAGLKVHTEVEEDVPERLDGPTVDYAEEKAEAEPATKKASAKKSAAKKTTTSNK